MKLSTHNHLMINLAFCVVLCLSSSCLRSSKWNDEHNTYQSWVSQPIHINSGLSPKFAISGILETNKYSINGDLQRIIENKGSTLRSLSNSIKNKFSSISKIPTTIRMSIPKDMLCSATDDTNGFCILPSRVIDSPFIDQLKNDGYSHIILVFGETKFYKGKTDVNAADPQVLLTQTYNDYNFNVYARVYDLQTGEEINEISLSDDTRSYLGTMAFLPWTIMVNQSSFYDAMGRRIGEELARCIQYDNSSEVYRNTVAQ